MNVHHPLSRRRQTRAVLESIEQRILLTTNAWKAAVSGDWDTAANWSLNHVPTASEDVAITVSGSYTVTKSVASADSCASITSTEPLDISGGTLMVSGNVQVNNTFTISGGILAGATVLAGSGGQGVIATAGSLDNDTLSANVLIPDGGNLYSNGALNLNNSTITITSSGTQTSFYLGSNETLGGNGDVLFAGSAPANDRLNSYNAFGPSTIGAGITIHGEGGTFYYNDVQAAFINLGTIDSDVAGQTMNVNCPIENKGLIETTNGGNLDCENMWSNDATGTFDALGGGILTLGQAAIAYTTVNAGTLTETDSTLEIGNIFTSTGHITRTGGTLTIIGTYDLGGGTLTLTPTTGAWALDQGGGVENGAVVFTGADRLVPVSAAGGTLINTTLDSNFPIPDGTSLTITNGITLNNVKIRIQGATAQTSLIFDDNATSETIGGSGQIIFAGADTSMDQTFVINRAGTTTLGPGITVRGANGRMYLNDVQAAYINEGVIEDDVPGTTFQLQGFEMVNKGVIEAAPGTINFNGGFDFSQGTITVGIGGSVAGTSYGQFIADGPASTLGGTVNTPLLPGFVPSSGETFTPFNYTSATGAFAHLNTRAGSGVSFTPDTGASSLTLTAVIGGSDFATLSSAVLTVNGTAGADSINLSRTNDLDFASLNATSDVFFGNQVTQESVAGNAGNDTISSSLANDTLSGGAGNDIITGSAGYDLLEGAGGDDSINGGSGGNDSMRGGGENDTLLSVSGNSTVVGGGGDDLITGGSGADTLVGGPGNDSIITGTGSHTSVSGGIGNDTINATAGTTDTLDGGDGTDVITASVGTDSIVNVP